MLSHDLTNLRMHWLGVLRGDVPPPGPERIADLVNGLGDCIAQAEALERGIVPQTLPLVTDRDERSARDVVRQWLDDLPTDRRRHAEAVMDAVTTACRAHLDDSAAPAPRASRRRKRTEGTA